MPRVTRLRAAARGRVAVEVDGKYWRTFPADVVARARLASGVELERPLLRSLRRELRRERALAAATRALRAQPLSERRLEEHLQRAGFVPAERSETLVVLRRAGFVDDERFALARAEHLAEKGAGDALIRDDLERHGIAEASAAAALEALEPEATRARRVAALRGGGPATARYLARRGFGEEAIEAALGSDVVADWP